MTTEAIKSASVTRFGTNPPTRSTSGKGAGGRVVQMDDYVTPTNGKTTGSVSRFMRVPSNCVVKRLELESHGTITTLTGDLGLYYSDNPIDFTGKQYAHQDGGVISAALFGSAIAMATPDVPVSATNESGSYDVSKRQKELWDAAGLSEDPGGFFDIAFTSTATYNLTNGAVLGCAVEFVVPNLG